mmetsp:Transcript_17065/g.26351  ORF Transcript_17065/g.26351 Transcript_17065/m.26351 type:complete len:101 (+) Transcript_17065:1658-1960(+)
MAKQTIGRSSKSDIQLRIRAISGEHCNLSYSLEKGWIISEKGKKKLSSNGTFVFVKSHAQIGQRVPSDLIPLEEGMVISFINYELKVSFKNKTEVQNDII